MSERVREWERIGCFDFPPITTTWNPQACLARKCPKDVGHVVSDGTSVFRRWVRGKCWCRSLLSELNTHTLLLTWPSIFNMPNTTTPHYFLPTKPVFFYTYVSLRISTYNLHFTLYTRNHSNKNKSSLILLNIIIFSIFQSYLAKILLLYIYFSHFISPSLTDISSSFTGISNSPPL